LIKHFTILRMTQVPIQVNKYLVSSDGMKVIESGKLPTQIPSFDGRLFTEMDKYVCEIPCCHKAMQLTCLQYYSFASWNTLNYKWHCRPNGQPCAETDEFNLLNNMLKAVDEERYDDAGNYGLLIISIIYWLWFYVLIDDDSN